MRTPSAQGILEPPEKYEYLVKRIIDLDLKENGGSGQYAFFEEPPDVSNEDFLFSEFAAFHIGIALHLVDSGSRRQRVVRHLMIYKDAYWKEYRRFVKKKKKKVSDEDVILKHFTHFYAAFRKPALLELRSIYGVPSVPPLFFKGTEEIGKYFSGPYPDTDKKALIIEIGHILVALRKHLDNAPKLKRDC